MTHDQTIKIIITSVVASTHLRRVLIVGSKNGISRKTFFIGQLILFIPLIFFLIVVYFDDPVTGTVYDLDVFISFRRMGLGMISGLHIAVLHDL